MSVHGDESHEIEDAVSFYRTAHARPLGRGLESPPGSLVDGALAARLKGYRRLVAARYITLVKDELDSAALPHGPLYVSPKIDGELWFLVLDPGRAILANTRGRILSGDLPLLNEAREMSEQLAGRVVIAGELYATSTRGQRPRIADLQAVMTGGVDADVRRLHFMAFDLLAHPDAASEPELLTDPDASVWSQRHRLLEALLRGGRRLSAVSVTVVSRGYSIRRRYETLVETGRAEGLVARALDGRIFKIKPTIDVDVAVLGFTGRQDAPDRVTSLLVGCMRDDGQLQILGAVDDLDGEENERALMQALAPLATESAFRHASADGALYRFVRPELVVAVQLADARSTDSGDRALKTAVLRHGEDGWRPVRRMPGAQAIRARFLRVRDDKEVNRVDVRIEQLLDRCLISELGERVQPQALPKSALVRREVYKKIVYGGLGVRKLMVWKTNKELLDNDYPAFVVHFTDYSPGRRSPLKRTVRLAPDASSANAVADALIRAQIKSGWERVLPPSTDDAAQDGSAEDGEVDCTAEE